MTIHDIDDIDGSISKSLIAVEEFISKSKTGFEDNVFKPLGITPEGLEMDLPNMLRENIQLREGVIHLTKRPSFLVKNHAVEPVGSPTWADILNGNADTFSKTLPSVGRVEIDNHINYKWVGTACLVAPTIVATNRHVAEEFITENEKKWVWRRNSFTNRTMSARVDFREEYYVDEESEWDIANVLYVSKTHDLALFRLKKQPPFTPLEPDFDEAPDRTVCVIGYPNDDSRLYQPAYMEAAMRIFKFKWGVKRLAPGRVYGRDDENSYLTHDCTTLGGNSGSALLDIETGQFIGLHTGSDESWTKNYAVPAEVVFEAVDRFIPMS